ncbi:5'-nucleotidase C-terminal domain-containing protein [Tibeticola sp.]|uniref:bifunctional metallophosphatase/5'-nucleotidase n=1 Tax=Tibeticola sp. TaxID=2005368 RepID=UPI0025DEA15F|nr:5'-nucleotidase C-terminal domain-containing protein [Tibeticola sp.]
MMPRALPALLALCRAAARGVAPTLAAVLIAGCASPPPPDASGAEAGDFTLHIAHINDHHSQLDGFAGFELQVDGVPTRVTLGGMARQTAAFKALAAREPALLKLHAGDALTGTLYYTFFQTDADAALMNTVCFDAFIPGNHEFDDGDATLARLLDALESGPCPRPALLSANIVPAAGTPLAPAGRAPRLAPSAVRRVQGVDVGLVGVTVAGKTQVSSRPLASTRFLEEASAAQAAIDALRARGVRHIVLMTHIGYEADLALAQRLHGVDVILGGDSHTLLGDFRALGLGSAGAYPTQARNADGERVCIGQAWEYGKVFAHMQVRFDPQGRVRACGGQAELLIDGPFAQQQADGRWQPLDEAATQALRARLARQSGVQLQAPDPDAAQVLARFASQVAAHKAERIGTATEALCLVRVPGEPSNASAGVSGCEQANQFARGSDVAQAVAEAFLAASRRADVALQNAGGVRTPIAAGPITMETAFRVLPFANTLVEIELSGAELLQALEDGVANHLDLGRSDGSHPYAAGLRWRLDLRAPRGQRFQQVEVLDKASGRWLPLEPTRRYVLVTHDYLAAGRDGYDTLARLSAQGRALNTYLLYTQSFVEALRRSGTVARSPAARVSHQAVTTRDGRNLR